MSLRNASIGEDSENLPAITALAAMGLLTDDDALIDAAISEIQTMPVNVRHKLDPGGDVEDILAMHHLAEVCGCFEISTF